MSEEVDVDRALQVFQAFSVEAVDKGDVEPFLPACFLALAAREMGYYPTDAKLESFQKEVDDSGTGRIIFASFLQLCEDIGGTRGVPPDVIHKHMRVLDSGTGILTTAELRVLLTTASPAVSCGEVEAIVDMLDPDGTGDIPLEDLEAVLVDHQRPLAEMTRRRVTPRNSRKRDSRRRRVRRSLKHPDDGEEAAPEGGREHSSPRRRRSAGRTSGIVDDTFLSQPRTSRARLSCSMERGGDLDRTFRRTDHTDRMSSPKESSATAVASSENGEQPSQAVTTSSRGRAALSLPHHGSSSPTTGRIHPRSTRTDSRRLRQQHTDTSIIVDPTPLTSTVARKHADQGEGTVHPPDPLSTAVAATPPHPPLTAADGACGRDEPPHEPAADDSHVRGEGEGNEPATAAEAAKPKPTTRKSKNPLKKCCIVC